MMHVAVITSLLILQLIFAGFLPADEIQMVNGKVYAVQSWRFEGEVIILLLRDGKTLKFRREQVAKIQIDASIETKEISPREPFKKGPVIDGQSDPLMAMPDGVIEHFNQGNTAAAISTLLEADETYKESTDFKFVYGTLLMRAGHFDEAEDILKDALLEERENPGGYFALAQTLYYQGKWQEATDAYSSALRFTIPESARNNIQNRFDDIASFRGNTILENDLIFATFENRITARSQLKIIGENLILGLRAAMDAVGQKTNSRILVVLSAQSINNFIESNKNHGTYDGKVTIPVSIADSKAGKSIMIHEFVHALLHSKTYGNCPGWLHEGLAQLWTGTPLDSFRTNFSDYLNRGILLDDYSDGLSLVTYMFSKDQDGLRLDLLLNHLAKGKYIDEAFISVYGFSLEKLRKDRDTWLHEYLTNANL